MSIPFAPLMTVRCSPVIWSHLVQLGHFYRKSSPRAREFIRRGRFAFHAFSVGQRQRLGSSPKTFAFSMTRRSGSWLFFTELLPCLH